MVVLMEKIHNVVLLIWFAVVFTAMAFGLVTRCSWRCSSAPRVRLFSARHAARFILGQVLVESLICWDAAARQSDIVVERGGLKGGIDLSMFAEGLEMVGMSPSCTGAGRGRRHRRQHHSNRARGVGESLSGLARVALRAGGSDNEDLRVMDKQSCAVPEQGLPAERSRRGGACRHQLEVREGFPVPVRPVRSGKSTLLNLIGDSTSPRAARWRWTHRARHA